MGDGVLFADSPEWADVVPVPQNDGPNPVVPIKYTQQFQDAMDYFRAVLVNKEYSERSLKLTDAVIQQNAANYTAWHYRRQCLAALGKDWNQELMYITESILENPKNYQVWYHRKCVVEKMGSAAGELQLVAEVLEEDGKNYHAWGHRQWVIQTFNLWDGELEFIDNLLTQDIRNNSAWNQRYFVLQHSPNPTDPEVIQREINYAFSKIALARNNSSPWSYVKGVVQPLGFSNFPSVKEKTAAVLEVEDDCAAAMSMMIDILEESGQQTDAQQAMEMCKRLAENIDSIRCKYWNYRYGLLEAAATG